MSGKNLSERLAEILSRIAEVQDFVANLDHNAFCNNRLAVRAVERNLEVIGEITQHIPSALKESCPDIQWQNIIGMRNILAHGYDVILEDALWLTARDDLLPLAAAIKKLQKHLKLSAE